MEFLIKEIIKKLEEINSKGGDTNKEKVQKDVKREEDCTGNYGIDSRV